MSGSRFIRIKVWEKCVLSSEKFVFLSVYVFEVVWRFENTSHQFTCWQWGKGFSQLTQFKDTAKVQTENMLTLLYGWLIGLVIQVYLCGSLSISVLFILMNQLQQKVQNQRFLKQQEVVLAFQRQVLPLGNHFGNSSGQLFSKITFFSWFSIFVFLHFKFYF